MFNRILFPTDGSDGAAVALDHLLDFATRHNATIHILNVANTTPVSVPQMQENEVDALVQEGERLVSEAANQARRRGIDTVTEVLQGKPYRKIVGYAETNGLDLVVMPTHGRRGLERFLLGSTTERVVRRADVPVLTIHPDADGTITYPHQDILVPTDGSDCANQALALGVDLIDTEGAALHLLSVIAVAALGVNIRTDIQMDLLEQSAHELLDEAATVAENAGVEQTSKTVEYGASIHKAILAYIDKHDIDLVVVGTHGRTGFDRYVLGSVTEYLIRTSPIPVLTVPAPDPDTEEIH
ncbi:universal stress protein [Natronoarchaeum sp. GCM10025703]|uniref:universal stress protein n=1 Tax=unclassified Natronoarchaeum TaxID=2620183 RepID=UPI00361F9111